MSICLPRRPRYQPTTLKRNGKFPEEQDVDFNIKIHQKNWTNQHKKESSSDFHHLMLINNGVIYCINIENKRTKHISKEFPLGTTHIKCQI
jgi:hypothetical protein